MEFKGTKGKWVVAVANMKDNNNDELVISVDGGEKIKEGYRLIACISPWSKHDDIDIANAKLIATAPELLESLQDLVKFCQDNQVGAELELAQSAINKALGHE